MASIQPDGETRDINTMLPIQTNNKIGTISEETMHPIQTNKTRSIKDSSFEDDDMISMMQSFHNMVARSSSRVAKTCNKNTMVLIQTNNKSRTTENQDIEMSVPSGPSGKDSSASRVDIVHGTIVEGGVKKFVLKIENLAPELRMMIFDLALVGSWNGQIPALLKALRGDELMYKEAIEAFGRTNTFVLSKSNNSSFLRMSETALGSIEYLKMGEDA